MTRLPLPLGVIWLTCPSGLDALVISSMGNGIGAFAPCAEPLTRILFFLEGGKVLVRISARGGIQGEPFSLLRGRRVEGEPKKRGANGKTGLLEHRLRELLHLRVPTKG